jgi:hypothetical protein
LEISFNRQSARKSGETFTYLSGAAGKWRFFQSLQREKGSCRSRGRAIVFGCSGAEVRCQRTVHAEMTITFYLMEGCDHQRDHACGSLLSIAQARGSLVKCQDLLTIPFNHSAAREAISTRWNVHNGIGRGIALSIARTRISRFSLCHDFDRGRGIGLFQSPVREQIYCHYFHLRRGRVFCRPTVLSIACARERVVSLRFGITQWRRWPFSIALTRASLFPRCPFFAPLPGLASFQSP